MIDWKLEAGDVACPVDDMMTTDCPRSFVQRGEIERRENESSNDGILGGRNGWKRPRGVDVLSLSQCGCHGRYGQLSCLQVRREIHFFRSTIKIRCYIAEHPTCSKLRSGNDHIFRGTRPLWCTKVRYDSIILA